MRAARPERCTRTAHPRAPHMRCASARAPLRAARPARCPRTAHPRVPHARSASARVSRTLRVHARRARVSTAQTHAGLLVPGAAACAAFGANLADACSGWTDLLDSSAPCVRSPMPASPYMCRNQVAGCGDLRLRAIEWPAARRPATARGSPRGGQSNVRQLCDLAVLPRAGKANGRGLRVSRLCRAVAGSAGTAGLSGSRPFRAVASAPRARARRCGVAWPLWRRC